MVENQDPREMNASNDAVRAEAGHWLSTRLREGPPLLLDGALGTELEVRGIPCGLPLWSSHALLETPAAIEAIQREYAEAGSEILTANTFRTQARVLARARDRVAPRLSQLGDSTDWGRELVGRAIDITRAAAAAVPGAVRVAGSAPPLEDCYRPDLVPEPEALEVEHREHVRNLVEGGSDLVLIETMNTIREAVAAARAAAESPLPFLVSFVSWRDAALLSGEPLSEAIESVRPLGPAAVAVNCLPPSAVAACLPVLRDCGLPFGVYANLGEVDASAAGERREACQPQEFADHAEGWIAAGARIVGGCCGTSPRHIAAIRDRGLAGRTTPRG